MSWQNKRVLKCFSTVLKVSQFWSSCGKLFHTQSVATENRRPPNTVLRGTVSRSWVDERSMHSGWYECSVSETYCSWSSIRDQKHNVDSLNWILESTGKQCKWWSCCEEDICWLLAARFCTCCNLLRFLSNIQFKMCNWWVNDVKWLNAIFVIKLWLWSIFLKFYCTSSELIHAVDCPPTSRTMMLRNSDDREKTRNSSISLRVGFSSWLYVAMVSWVM